MAPSPLRPGLRAALLGALLALPFAARAQQGPEEPYRPGSLPLTADEQALLAASPPSGAALTNRAVLEYVTGAEVSRLKSKVDSGAAVEDADRSLAARLYWTRGEVLSDPDAEFLRSLNPLALGAVPRPGRGKDGSAVSIRARHVDRKQAEAVLAELRKLVAVDDRGSKEERAVLDDAFRRMVGTPTGLETAREFVALGRPAKVQFFKTNPDGGGVQEFNGRKVLMVSGANTDTDAKPPTVRLDEEYLQTTPSWRGPELAGTLAHELLGHALLRHKAEQAGPDAVAGNEHFASDEVDAGLTGWLVQAEQGAPLDDGNMWNFVADPAGYSESLVTNLPYYAGTFTVEEMKDPVDTLKKRLGTVQGEEGNLPEVRRDLARQRQAIAHFITEHKVPARKFASLDERLRNSIAWYDGHAKNLQDIEQYIKRMIAEFEADGGKKARELQAAAANPYFADTTARTARLGARLQQLTAGKKQADRAAPPPPGSLGETDLNKMISDDNEHADFWRKLWGTP